MSIDRISTKNCTWTAKQQTQIELNIDERKIFWEKEQPEKLEDVEAWQNVDRAKRETEDSLYITG